VVGATHGDRAAGSRLPDRVAIGVLTSVFPPALVDEVIETAQARELRKRSLPARLMVYFTLALWLFAGSGYDAVIRNLVEGLAWTRTGWGQWRVPSTGSLTKARARLGARPLELLFRRVAGPVGTEAAAGVFWRGLRLVSVDGTSLETPDSAANSARFGHPTSTGDARGAFPQITLVALAECGTRALIDAAFGGYRTSEQELAQVLVGSMTAGMLVLADRNFPGGPLWTAATAGGAQLLWRIKTNQFALPVEQTLPDGTYLSSFTSGKGKARLRIQMRGNPLHRDHDRHRHRRAHRGGVLPGHHADQPRHRSRHRTRPALPPAMADRNLVRRAENHPTRRRDPDPALTQPRGCQPGNLGDALRLPSPARSDGPRGPDHRHTPVTHQLHPRTTRRPPLGPTSGDFPPCTTFLITSGATSSTD
jgi:hypothetical protein